MTIPHSLPILALVHRIVLAPKVGGAYHLHELTKEDKLDLFVMFSSIASTIPSPGQLSYTCSNAYLDAIAHKRVAEGLPALCIR